MTQKSYLQLNQLTLPVWLGWPNDERQKKQLVSLNIKLQFPSSPIGCQTDNLADTTCYAELVQTIQNNIENKHFRLLEHFAAEIYRMIQQILPAGILISVEATKKPNITHLNGGVSFCYGDAI